MSWPSWWEADREHGPALLAFRFVHATQFIVDDPDAGWIFDFEGAWERGPCSSGERILIALAWCLYNLNWAAEHERKANANDELGPLYLSNPSCAAGTLGDSFWKTYGDMLTLARRDR